MTVACPSRTDRRDPGGARVTARDLLLLRLIEEAQPVTSTQVAAFAGMSGDMARRRLRVLRDLGLVTVHVVAMHDPNRYTLARDARPVLARAFGGDPGGYRVRRSIARLHLAHHDGQVDLFVALQIATARSKHWSLNEFLFEVDVRRRAGAGTGTLVPDCVAVLESADGRRVAFVGEIDQGSENPSWFTNRKALPYSVQRAAGQAVVGCEEWRVCVVTATARRRNRLVLAAWEAGIDEGVLYFAVADEIHDRNVLNDVWLTPRVAPDGGSTQLVAESPLPIRKRPSAERTEATEITRKSTREPVTTAVTVRHDGPGAFP